MDGIQFQPSGITALADLLHTKETESDSDNDLDTSNAITNLGPGDVGPKPPKRIPAPKKVEGKPSDPKDIWTPDEVSALPEFEDMYDERPQPEFKIIYKQQVTSEDVYLQMGNKTPASFSCEQMVVKIELPATKSSDINLDVTKTFLDCRTPKIKLGLHLPHQVESDSAKAQWDPKKELLLVTLKIIRELDDLNF